MIHNGSPAQMVMSRNAHDDLRVAVNIACSTLRARHQHIKSALVIGVDENGRLAYIGTDAETRGREVDPNLAQMINRALAGLPRRN